MKVKIYAIFLTIVLSANVFSPIASNARPIYFCGEEIPISNAFVADKLMNIIRKQIPNVNLPSLRYRAMQYFPYIENFLRQAGLPTDFKYLPIVESNFQLLTSRVGAQGIWQLMAATASEKGLNVGNGVDDRNDVEKSTAAAAKVLAGYYNDIARKFKVYSWVLTAAAYNFGIGNIFKAMSKQGTDYFSMNLNPETAIYVYKIIAVKELFEFPELYMKNIGYNVFSTDADKSKLNKGSNSLDTKDFTSLALSASASKPSKAAEKVPNYIYLSANVKGDYKNFKDGDFVYIKLKENLSVKGSYESKGSVIQGTGWLIDGRIYVDLGYGHDVILCDSDSKKGIAFSSLKNKVPVWLKKDLYDEEK